MPAHPNPATSSTPCAQADRPDPWDSTIGLLRARQAFQLYADCAWPDEEDSGHHRHTAIVSVVERPSPTLAVINWRDATHCRYGAQIWTAISARGAGVCALSGLPIAKGQAVYRPRPCRPPARNAEAMILASALHAACGTDAGACGEDALAA
ncbi:DUF3331 domain-containing protein [Cupriavidus basilensis]|uniref:DUF3331 domain-containing protein n=1 Tax=Cupriavidus basilensis TaxID=68895 RepID=A0A643FPB7_9BURK|nr:DUF3331 domain-containing protein [Cupriavidus basilensis]QOT79298.1 DUF3331 domain-containing protein [Cupriavidus basilensis]